MLEYLILLIPIILIILTIRNKMVLGYRLGVIDEWASHIYSDAPDANEKYKQLREEYYALPSYKKMLFKVWVWPMWKFNIYEVKRRKGE